MNRRSVLKLATTSLILAAPAIKASTGVFRPATTGNRHVVHVNTMENLNESLDHEIFLFDRITRNKVLIDRAHSPCVTSDLTFNPHRTDFFKIGTKLGAAVETHTGMMGTKMSRCYPGATFNNHGDASYEDGRYYPKLIKMLPEPGEHTIKIPRLSA